ncbi:MAG TPA: prepilin-type N-terminal cleavage/methylation domain-containing protein [Verrucomicrobiae bacterium]|jgi:prepilin-type N-terminal cleavage/methylation domain-containing protein
MNAFFHNHVRPSRQSAQGFTLVEMMVALAVFTLVIMVTLATQVYGTRVYTLAATKLSATTSARMALNDIRDEIRQGQIVNVGNYIWTGNDPAATNFTPISDGNPQQGNALIIYPSSTNAGTFTLMYLQPGSGTNYSLGTPASTNCLILETYRNGALAQSNDVANFITNQVIFTAQDYENNILTNNVNNRVIQVQMFFSQWEFPIAFIGTNGFNAYDYYRLQTRITRRLFD